jgi:hypothetical protein
MNSALHSFARIGNMRSLRVRSLAASCELCHHAALLNAEPWPDNVPVPTFGPRMDVHLLRPNWREQRERPSLTGTQWRN